MKRETKGSLKGYFTGYLNFTHVVLHVWHFLICIIAVEFYEWTEFHPMDAVDSNIQNKTKHNVQFSQYGDVNTLTLAKIFIHSWVRAQQEHGVNVPVSRHSWLQSLPDT